MNPGKIVDTENARRLLTHSGRKISQTIERFAGEKGIMSAGACSVQKCALLTHTN
jgi:hypothetical protein